MIVIGVTGKSGAGKTTFTDYLGERKNVGVIHLDDMVNRVKEDRFQKQIRKRNKNNDPVLLPSNLHAVINNNRFVFKAFCRIKKHFLKDRIAEEIKRFKAEGKDAVVIESCYLTDLVDRKLFNKIICVKRPFKKRVQAVMEREQETESKVDMVTRDMPYKRRISSVKESDFDYVILNTNGKDELKNASDKIYDEVVGIQTFDEWVKVDNGIKPRVKKIAKVICTKSLARERAEK